MLSDAQRAGQLRRHRRFAIRCTGLPFPNNTIPADRLDPAALKLLNEFVPAPTARATATSSRLTRSTIATSSACVSTTSGPPANRCSAATCCSQTDRTDPPTTRPIGTVAKATLQDCDGRRHVHLRVEPLSTSRGSRTTASAPYPQATSGLSNSAYGINVPQNSDTAHGLANITITGFFSLGDVQQPFVDRMNEVLAVRRRLDVDARRACVEVRPRHPPRAHGHRVREPAERRLHVHRRHQLGTGNAAADFLLGLPAQFRRTTQNTDQDGIGWLYCGYAQDEFRPCDQRDGQRRACATRCRCRLSTRTTRSIRSGPGSSRRASRGAPLGLVYPGEPACPRGTYETDKNNFAPRLGVVWDPTGTGRSSLRGAWGIFYDALAGQGDFFQNGVLAPPFTPLLEVNAPPAALTLQQSAERRSRGGADRLPARTHLHRLGRGLLDAVRAALQPDVAAAGRRRLGAEVGYVGSRGYNLPIFMEVNPGALHARADGRRRAALPGVRAGAADVLGRAVLVRLAAGQPADAADAAASTSSRPTRSATPSITCRA